MNERDALSAIGSWLPAAGDDAAVVGNLAITTDMLHASTDFPDGVSRYTAGWRAIGASLSDVAAMGASATAAVAVYGAPTFEERALADFVRGAREVCAVCNGEYVGGDLDSTGEFTACSTVVGTFDSTAPVFRSGATPGDRVYVTGTLGRSARGIEQFAAGDVQGGNETFRFRPRVAAGIALAPHASAMMDVSDGLARSIHQLAAASDCGFAIESPLPIDPELPGFVGEERARDLGLTFGEDFELLLTVPETELAAVDALETGVDLTPIGRVTDSGITLDGDPLSDRGYDHG